MRFKELSKNLTLLLATLIFFFLIIEGGFKILHLISDAEVNPTDIKDLPYENTPGGWFLRYDYSSGWVMYKNNSLGMRDVERSFKKDTGIKRIVCLGDSVMFGARVPFEKIYTRQLEKLLNQSYSSVEVLNCGTTSYSLREYLIYFNKKAVKFDPDILIIGLYLNDYATLFHVDDKTGKVNLIGEKEQGQLIKTINKIKRFIFHSYFVEYVQALFETLRLDKKQEIYAEFKEAKLKESWDSAKQYFEEFKQICAKKKIPLIILIFPHGQQLQNYFPEIQPQMYLKEMLNELNIYNIDLLPVFYKVHSKKNEVYGSFDIIHPLAPGHYLAAQETEKLINKNNLLLK